MKIKKFLQLASIFIIIYIPCLFFFINMRSTHGNVELFSFTIVIVIPIVFLMNIITLKRQKEKGTKNYSTRTKYILRALIILMAGLLLYYKPYDLDIILLIVFLVMAVLLYAFKIGYKIDEWTEKNSKNYIIFLSAVMIIYIIIIPFILLNVYDAKTVSEAEVLLQSEGYTDINYVSGITREDFVKMFFRGTKSIDTKKGKDLKAYIFEATKDGKKEAVVLDIMGGKILAHDLVDKTSIEYYRE